MAFMKDYAVRADGNTEIFVKYTNKASCVEYCIRRFKYWLQNDDQKIVALDVEFTWPPGPTQMAVVVQLCVGIYVLVYHISVADEHCGLLATFLLDEEYTFVGVDIKNDQKKLKHVGLVVCNFVDIQNMWRVPDLVTIKPKYGLAYYTGSIIHHSYNKMKDAITEDDHHIWAEAPLPLKNIYYASRDAYATYDVYRRLVNFHKGFKTQCQHLTKPSRRSRKSGRKNEST
ncbi:uncharacterized protein [Aegilops tauschii subsp. strangulata]|uniref:uncharacterized protein n=1 Tax=Aegilops tauschii subsp. strangulata TaxID=200361 RepID=UPI00098AC162|nr:Werner syndrome ATP-dependent helicase-like [Aegilops tauschii subsp. strangulata]